MSDFSDFRVNAIETKPIIYNWSELYGTGWKSIEAGYCETCMNNNLPKGDCIVVGPPGTYCEQCDSDMYFEGPMMNYYYPVDIDDMYEAAKAIIDLPLCVVEVDDNTGLALTGGGMDLSWDICDAFIQLGYLPPLHFCRLPDYVGMKLDERIKTILNACKKSAQISSRWAKGILSNLEYLEKRLSRNE